MCNNHKFVERIKKGGMEMESLKNHILQLESDLLKPEIRQSIDEISELLSDGFIEFCSSGYVWHYNKGESVDEEIQEINWQIKNFTVNQLSDNCVLATYKLIKHNELDENKKYSLRSSIWKYYDGKWKMLFHQGTLTSQI